MNYNNIISAITNIYNKYDEIYDIWIEEIGEDVINLKKSYIEDFTIGNNIEYINKYRNCISNNSFEFIDELNKMNVTSRIKTINSYESKLNRYVSKSDNGGNVGKFSIIKCLNDIFGTRIIVTDDNDYNDIISKLKNEYSESRVYLKEDNGYIGVHFYFKRDNKMLPWELQIWRECDEINNKESHRMYKQGYTDWEKLSKRLSLEMNVVRNLSQEMNAIRNISLQTSAVRNLLQEMNTIRNISLQTSVVRNLSQEMNAIRNISLQTSAVRNLLQEMNAVRDISLQTNAIRNLSQEMNTFKDISLQTNAFKNLSHEANIFNNFPQGMSAFTKQIEPLSKLDTDNKTSIDNTLNNEQENKERGE